MNKNKELFFNKLSNSKFRSSFYLTEKDKKYVLEKGIETIRKHGYDFINNRLAAKNPINDGKQTPMRGHPIFIAQHACACCCRSCLKKWHGIPQNRELTEEEVDYIIDILISWIIKQLKEQ